MEICESMAWCRSVANLRPRQAADVLLLDEPTGHLDFDNINWLVEYIKIMEASGTDECSRRPSSPWGTATRDNHCVVPHCCSACTVPVPLPFCLLGQADEERKVTTLVVSHDVPVFSSPYNL